MDISQEDVKLLMEQVRELTSRVHRLEQLLHISPPSEISAGKAEISVRQLAGEENASPPAPPSPPSGPPSTRVPNLESRIGAHWLNRIGIAAVLIGVSYFLKFAFENGWIGPAGRVAIGLIAGIAVVLWSERFRSRGYRVFSYSLKAVGIGTLYLSLWASFQVYHLMPSEVVFACMLIVTGATCAMALTQDAEILAVFAIAGGFATPALLSTGVNRELALFSYVLLLDLGILGLVILKPWRRLLWFGFAGTLALYIAWYSEFYERSQITPTLIFATLFFAVFAIAPLFMLRQEHGAGGMPLGLALVNAITYFLQTYVMVSEISTTEMAWFSLALAAVYITLNRFRPRSSEPAAEHNLRLMHLALAIGLITVAIPIRLEQHWITIGWFVEAAVLLWIGQRINSDLLNVFALAALVLGVGRLLFFDNFHPTQLIFNLRMAVYAVAVAVLALVAYTVSKREDEAWRMVGAVALVAMNALALVALSREVADYYSRQFSSIREVPGVWRGVGGWQQIRSIEIARDFSYSALWMAYGAMLMIVGFWRSSAFVRWQALALIAATTGKVFVHDVFELDRVYRILSFVALGVLLLAISFAYQRDWLKLSARKPAEAQPQR
ncbi:MAG TPA: DUF2339 domain-containing protein [Terriglobales bacterium]